MNQIEQRLCVLLGAAVAEDHYRTDFFLWDVRHQVAHHEIGHAVCRLALGGEIHSLTIEPVTVGNVIVLGSVSHGARPADSEEEAKSDVEQIAHYLTPWRQAGLDEEALRLKIETLKREAYTAVVEKNWAAVRVIVAQLYRKPTLTGEEVSAALRDAGVSIVSHSFMSACDEIFSETAASEAEPIAASVDYHPGLFWVLPRANPGRVDPLHMLTSQ